MPIENICKKKRQVGQVDLFQIIAKKIQEFFMRRDYHILSMDLILSKTCKGINISGLKAYCLLRHHTFKIT